MCPPRRRQPCSQAQQCHRSGHSRLAAHSPRFRLLANWRPVSEGCPATAGRCASCPAGGRRSRAAGRPTSPLRWRPRWPLTAPAEPPAVLFTGTPCSFHFWITVVPVSDAYPGMAGSRTCLRVVAGVKPQVKPRGEASAAACAFWRASTQRSILILAGSTPRATCGPGRPPKSNHRRASSHPPAAVLWWPPSIQPVATSG